MRILFLGVVSLCLATGACGGRSTPSVQPTPSNGKISFGIYDISRSGPFSIFTDAMPRETNVVESSNIAAAPIADEEQSTVRLDPLTAPFAGSPVPSDRKIIRNAELNLEADNPEASEQLITEIAESKGGFVVESQQSSSDIQATTRDIVLMSIRIPSDRFSETLDEVRETASRVVIETVKGEDVTDWDSPPGS